MSDKKFEVIQFDRYIKKEDPPMHWTIIFNDGTMTEVTADLMDPEFLPFMLFAKKTADGRFDIVHSVNFDLVKEMKVTS